MNKETDLSVNKEISVQDVRIYEKRSGIPLADTYALKQALETLYNTFDERNKTILTPEFLDKVEKEELKIHTSFDRIRFVHENHPEKYAVERYQALNISHFFEEVQRKTKNAGDYYYHGHEFGRYFPSVLVQKTGENVAQYLLNIQDLPDETGKYKKNPSEVKLAENLGIKRALQSKKVEVELKHQGLRSDIDFNLILVRVEPIIRSLQPRSLKKRLIGNFIASQRKVTGDEIANYLAVYSNFYGLKDNYSLGILGDLEVLISLDKRGFNPRERNILDFRKELMWKANGSVVNNIFCGEIPPTINFEVVRNSKSKWDRLPAIDQETHDRMNDLTDQITRAFKT